MAETTTTGVQLGDEDAVRASVSKYYGETLQASSDLKTSACCTAKAPPKEVIDVLRQLPQEIISRYYGCGSPFPLGLKGSGLRVLDLGCGTGRDCYVCAALVGQEGFVTGIDMTDAQLEVAERHSIEWQQHLGYSKPNMKFVKGAIEQLSGAGLEAGSVDVVISNCVINLSPDKAAVLKETYRVLAEGGEVFFSDVYCDRRLAPEVRVHEVLLGECLGGALHVNDFVRLAQQVGFTDPRVLEAEPIAVHDPQLRELLGDAAFYSITFRLFKLPGKLEPLPEEDYDQTLTYNGSLPGAPDKYVLDHQHTFPTGEPVRVSGNTAAMCASSWLGSHFKLTGSTAIHKGQFTAGSSTPVTASSIAALAASSSSTGGGSCCPPKAAPSAAAAGGCCGSAAAPEPAPAAAAGPEKASCCPPAAPAAAPASSCCAPKPAAAAGGCCAPSAAAPAAANGLGSSGAAGGCCVPASKPAGCCGPTAAPEATNGSCCAPASAAAAAEAAATAPPLPAGGSSACCGGRKCC